MPRGGRKKKVARPVVLATLSDTEDPAPVPAPAPAPDDEVISSSPMGLVGTHIGVFFISTSCQEREETTSTTDTRRRG